MLIYEQCPSERDAARSNLAILQTNPDLSSIRDPSALAKLPADECLAFTQLWADVAALLKHAETPAKQDAK